MELVTIVVILHILTAVFLTMFKIRVERTLPRLDRVGEVRLADTVSVIVPARNEENDIRGCLESYLAQNGVPLEVIVVDDGSTDRTAIIAGEYSSRGVRVLKADRIPKGWVGKNWACHLGYGVSSGEWLLFTDSDTRVESTLVARAVALATEKRLDMLTLYPRFGMRSPVLKAVLPILLIGLYLIGRPDKVNRGTSAFAFGSFILIRRDAYQRIGGHQRVRNSIVEDRALAIVGRKQGLRMLLADSCGLMTAAWNRDLKSLWMGMIRLFTSIFLGHKIKPILFFAAIAFVLLTPVITFLVSAYSLSINLILSAVSVALISTSLGLESMRHGGGPLGFILWIAGSPLVLAAILVSWRRARVNPVITWRGRRYKLAMGAVHEVAEPIS
jgi:chlorobactene glucosyltransferase